VNLEFKGLVDTGAELCLMSKDAIYGYTDAIYGRLCQHLVKPCHPRNGFSGLGQNIPKTESSLVTRRALSDLGEKTSGKGRLAPTLVIFTDTHKFSDTWLSCCYTFIFSPTRHTGPSTVGQLTDPYILLAAAAKISKLLLLDNLAPIQFGDPRTTVWINQSGGLGCFRRPTTFSAAAGDPEPILG